MRIEALKAAVETYRADVERDAGGAAGGSEYGPVGMRTIDLLVSALEAQQRQIDELERKFKEWPHVS
jgi:hypothetical protein